MMEPDKLVRIAVEGMAKNKFEIYPGLSKILYLMSRVAPTLILNQMGKVAEKALAKKDFQSI